MGIRPPSLWLRRASEVAVLASAVAWMAPSAQSRPELGTLGIALVVAFLVLSLGIHEAAHAWVAWRCGDSTGRDLGRMTLNPIPHIDPFLTIILPTVLYMVGGIVFGGAKPVPVSYHRLRHPMRDMALVALAGPVTNFLLAIVFALAAKICLATGNYDRDSLMVMVLLHSMIFNVMLTAFNLLPIPPLDGSRVMTWLLPASIRPGYQALERFGILFVFLLLYIPGVRSALWDMNDGITNVVSALVGGIG